MTRSIHEDSLKERGELSVPIDLLHLIDLALPPKPCFRQFPKYPQTETVFFVNQGNCEKRKPE